MSHARLSLRKTAAIFFIGAAVLVGVAELSIQAPATTPTAMCALNANMFAPAFDAEEYDGPPDPNSFAVRMDQQYSYVPGGDTQSPQQEGCEQPQ